MRLRGTQTKSAHPAHVWQTGTPQSKGLHMQSSLLKARWIQRKPGLSFPLEASPDQTETPQVWTRERRPAGRLGDPHQEVGRG